MAFPSNWLVFTWIEVFVKNKLNDGENVCENKSLMFLKAQEMSFTLWTKT